MFLAVGTFIELEFIDGIDVTVVFPGPLPADFCYFRTAAGRTFRYRQHVNAVVYLRPFTGVSALVVLGPAFTPGAACRGVDFSRSATGIVSPVYRAPAGAPDQEPRERG